MRQPTINHLIEECLEKGYTVSLYKGTTHPYHIDIHKTTAAGAIGDTIEEAAERALEKLKKDENAEHK